VEYLGPAGEVQTGSFLGEVAEVETTVTGENGKVEANYVRQHRREKCISCPYRQGETRIEHERRGGHVLVEPVRNGSGALKRSVKRN